MRILHVSQPVEAGVPRVVVDLVTDQVQRGWDVVVACPPTGWLPDAARHAGARVLPWNATRSPGPVTARETYALARIIRQVQPGAVHLHSAKAALAGRLALRGRLPTVVQPHAWSFEAVTGLIGVSTRWWERWGARWSHLVVAVSEAERLRGVEAGIRSPAVVAPNGVDLDVWAPRDGAAVRAGLGLHQGPAVVCVGRLAPQKGQDLLVAAWPEIRRTVPDATLLLVGDGPDRAALEAAAGPGVLFVGPVDDAALWYAAADVVVAPSRWEGMALVPIEAMASGRSVVTTDVSGARETLGGVAGAIVPIGDRQALVEAVLDRLTDPSLAAREGAAGRARAVELFDVRRTSAIVGDAVARLAGARS
jgi:glycosyltransferase involved in cell wall biosynthesis